MIDAGGKCVVSDKPDKWSDTSRSNIILKVIYHPLYGMNNYVLIWGDWLSYHLSNLNNLHPLEVVDRVSETQLQVGENSN